MQSLEHLKSRSVVAYFSMEIAIDSDVPTYSGGLGVLAGDVIRTAADLGLPFVGVTLASRAGYFRQTLDASGRQTEEPARWDLAKKLTPTGARTQVSIGGRDVAVQAWVCDCQSPIGLPVPVLFLDTDLAENHADDRAITDALYAGDAVHRLKQEIVLGIGGARLLDALGLRVRKYHLNEGHSALLALELLGRGSAPLEDRLRAVREICVFTTHTPVEAGTDKFTYGLVREVLGPIEPYVTELGGADQLNLTVLGLNTCGYVNGVAERHREVSAAMFPGHRIFAITNGVHSPTWTCPAFRKLFDERLPGWAAEPQLLARVGVISDEEIWGAHEQAKHDLVELVRSAAGIALDPAVLTIGFARRMTTYKRPSLVFRDLERLRKIARRRPLQIVFAGKAHPKDEAGKLLIEDVFRAMHELDGALRVAYLPDYDMAAAKKLVAGVDVWLNTPQPPLEASGTSGMKAAHNGVLNFSVLDGWWLEGHLEGINGWAIGPHPKERCEAADREKLELDDLYGKLEFVIAPTYYDRRDEWVRLMKASIDDIASYFNAHRMLRRYVTDAYFPRER